MLKYNVAKLAFMYDLEYDVSEIECFVVLL